MSETLATDYDTQTIGLKTSKEGYPRRGLPAIFNYCDVASGYRFCVLFGVLAQNPGT